MEGPRVAAGGGTRALHGGIFSGLRHSPLRPLGRDATHQVQKHSWISGNRLEPHQHFSRD